jgi:glucose-1-phosphate thymidylyltransferase
VNAALQSALVDATGDLDERDGSASCRYLTAIANRPVLAHVVEHVAQAGIDEIVIAASASLRARLEPSFGSAASRGLKVTFHERTQPLDGLTLAAQLRSQGSADRLLLQCGDCLFPGQLTRLRDCALADDLDLALLVGSTGSNNIPGAGRVSAATRLRLPRDRPEGTAMILRESTWPVLEALGDRPFSATRLLEAAALEQLRIGVCEVGECWCYADSPEQLLVGNRIVLDELSSARAFSTAENSENVVEGRVSVSPSARISRSTLRGPIVIGDSAVVEDSFVGPYTSIGPGAKVVGAEIDYSIVLGDASVRHPGTRLHASVIGEHAQVTQSFALPTGLHLRIGPGSSVVLG